MTDANLTSLHVDVRVRGRIDVKLEAKPGFTVLFGPSGAGKTSTLLAIAGLLEPDDGVIRLGDTVYVDKRKHTSLSTPARGVGFVFQSLALFPHLDAIENVAYGLRSPRASRHTEARAWLERLRVGHVASRRPSTFSGGEAQRVALARALAPEPRVLLLDEPFSALDDDLRRALRDDLVSIVRERAIPVVFVTHDRDEAKALADTVVVLAEGRVQRAGSPASVLG
jgi:molybdate transport system ATP-binding protein